MYKKHSPQRASLIPLVHSPPTLVAANTVMYVIIPRRDLSVSFVFLVFTICDFPSSIAAPLFSYIGGQFVLREGSSDVLVPRSPSLILALLVNGGLDDAWPPKVSSVGALLSRNPSFPKPTSGFPIDLAKPSLWFVVLMAATASRDGERRLRRRVVLTAATCKYATTLALALISCSCPNLCPNLRGSNGDGIKDEEKGSVRRHNIMYFVAAAAGEIVKEVSNADSDKYAHNLSELLLFHCSNDACELKEEDRNVLSNVISNLNTCALKNAEQMFLCNNAFSLNKILPSVPKNHMSISRYNLISSVNSELIDDWGEVARNGFQQSKLSSQCNHRYKIYAEDYAWSAEAIGRRGQQLMESLSMDRIYDYMFHLISEYSKLQDFKPTLPPTTSQVCAESVLCFADEKQRMYLNISMAFPSEAPPCTLQPAP
ncbi:O-glucosyltransferase rumi-like protein [Senna tora]|uniref:O-glucosyltransferase rumi-like protein n=1 Tax=Senna tora TaxID=362788 RepID=A0A834TTI8_9FABA|nr:O-glucosyltransferase rumi-like protein [Senna tora]